MKDKSRELCSQEAFEKGLIGRRGFDLMLGMRIRASRGQTADI
jgi:hypothetical protein